jgi:HAD superfamily hydrolase (TIGR01509 family)
VQPGGGEFRVEGFGGEMPDYVQMLISDVGGVLLDTDDGAFVRELARLAGRPAGDVALAVDKSGVYDQRDAGHLSLPEITRELREVLKVPELTEAGVAGAWNAVLGEPDPVLAPLAARLSRNGKLILATNTNDVHWPVVLDRLEAAGISRAVPAMPSFVYRVAKPDPRYYARLVELFLEPGVTALFVDDKPDNVQAARDAGLLGFLHQDTESTAAAIRQALKLA